MLFHLNIYNYDKTYYLSISYVIVKYIMDFLEEFCKSLENYYEIKEYDEVL